MYMNRINSHIEKHKKESCLKEARSKFLTKVRGSKGAPPNFFKALISLTQYLISLNKRKNYICSIEFKEYF